MPVWCGTSRRNESHPLPELARLTFANWRGVLAPPGISDDAKQAMVKVLEDLHGTQQWKEALVKNGWTDAFVTGPQFEQFLKDQDNRVASTLTELGLI